MRDRGQQDEKDEPDAEAPGDELFFDRQQGLACSLFEFARHIGSRHGHCTPIDGQLASGGLTPLKNSHEISRPTQITKPNRLMT